MRTGGLQRFGRYCFDNICIVSIYARSSCYMLQDVDFLEFFAGTANTTMMMRYAGLRAVKFDILYGKQKGHRHRSDYMNILDPSGFAFLRVNAFDIFHRFFCSCTVAFWPRRLAT